MSNSNSFSFSEHLATGEIYVGDLMTLDTALHNYFIDEVDCLREDATGNKRVIEFVNRPPHLKVVKASNSDPGSIFQLLQRHAVTRNEAKTGAHDAAIWKVAQAMGYKPPISQSPTTISPIESDQHLLAQLPIIALCRINGITNDVTDEKPVRDRYILDRNGEQYAMADLIPVKVDYVIKVLAWDYETAHRLAALMTVGGATSFSQPILHCQYAMCGEAIPSTATLPSRRTFDWTDESVLALSDGKRLQALSTEISVTAWIPAVRITKAIDVSVVLGEPVECD